MSVAVRFGVRRSQDAELGSLAMTSGAFVLTAIVGLAATRELDLSEIWPFLIAGLLAPGLSQVIFVRAVREVGAARSSVLMGTAPLVAVAIALVFLHEPVRAPLLIGAGLIVGGGIALARERVRPADFRRVTEGPHVGARDSEGHAVNTRGRRLSDYKHKQKIVFEVRVR